MNFDGLGNGGGYTPNAAPPDTNGAIGATQYVQWVNEAFAVYDKTTGARVAGPTNGNQLFQALGATHQCAVNNDGDPIVQYDKVNNRWVLTQFSVTNGTTKGFYQCIAVSQTSDATGAYNVYAFKEPNFNDYPKFGVWADGYYAPPGGRPRSRPRSTGASPPPPRPRGRRSRPPTHPAAGRRARSAWWRPSGRP